jgi:hypothetical protein
MSVNMSLDDDKSASPPVVLPKTNSQKRVQFVSVT